MSPQQKHDAKWNVGIIVTVLLATLGLSTQIGRYQERVDRLIEEKAQQQVIDASQNGRIGMMENRATALETDVTAIKEGRYTPKTTPAFPNKFTAGVGN